jgi:hypothetical protein
VRSLLVHAAMAASLGLNPEALFSSYSSSYSSPFMSGYAPQSFPAANNTVDDAAAFSSELDDLCQLEYSPTPLVAGAGGGSGDDRNDKSMYVHNLICAVGCGNFDWYSSLLTSMLW